jgi:hypothetical protein
LATASEKAVEGPDFDRAADPADPLDARRCLLVFAASARLQLLFSSDAKNAPNRPVAGFLQNRHRDTSGQDDHVPCLKVGHLNEKG